MLKLIVPGQPALVLVLDLQNAAMPGVVREIKDNQVIVEFDSTLPAIKPVPSARPASCNSLPASTIRNGTVAAAIRNAGSPRPTSPAPSPPPCSRLAVAGRSPAASTPAAKKATRGRAGVGQD